MLDLNDSFDKKRVSRKVILEKLSDEQLFRHYLGDFKIGKSMNSPLRKDNIPSFSVFRSKYHNKMMYKDHATGEWGDIFDLVSALYMTDLYGALIKINNDFDLGFENSAREKINYVSVAKPIQRCNISEPETKLEMKFRKWRTCDYKYWTLKYGINEEQLKYYKIFPVQTVFLNGNPIWNSTNDNPIYAYVFYKDGKYTYKAYRPLEKNKRYKWINNANRSVIQGWDQLTDSGPLLILTKSLKDVVVYRTLGFLAVSCQSELGIVKDTVMDELKRRFNKIVLQNDFDYAGVVGTNIMRKKYSLPYFFLQNFKTRSNGLKDISDYREYHSVREAKLFINEKLKNL